jgi:hypothetical protein
LPAFTGQPNLNIARTGTGNVKSPWSTLVLTTVAEAEADLGTNLVEELVDEVTTDGDVVEADILPMSLMGLTFPIQIAVSLHKSGKR